MNPGNRDGLPVPPAHVPKAKWDVWYDYWSKIYLDAEDTEREIRYNQALAEGMMSDDSSLRSEVEAN